MAGGRIVVAGAGPAGLSAATILAQHGHHVTVFDRVSLPRPRIGESLPPKVGPVLGILGVLDAAEAADFARAEATTVCRGGEVERHPFHPSGAERGYQVERDRFDQMLADRASALGVDVVARARVDSPLLVDGCVVGALIETREGKATVACDYLVDASGTAAIVGRALGLRRAERLRTVALSAYFRGSARPVEFSAHDTLFEMLPEGWVWSVLRRDGLRNVTIGLDAETVKQRAGTPEALHALMTQQSRLAGPLVERAEREGAVTTHDATWTWSSRYEGEGFVLVGDAASFVDPLTSQGVFKALRSGIMAAATVNTALVHPERRATAHQYHQDSQEAFVRGYRAIAMSFYEASPFVDAPFWKARLAGRETTNEPAAPIDDPQKRRAFLDAVQRLGADRVRVYWIEAPRVAQRPVARGGYVEEDDVLMGPSGPLELGGLDPAAVQGAAPGTIAEFCTRYVGRVGVTPSRERSRQLIGLLARLVERRVIAFDAD